MSKISFLWPGKTREQWIKVGIDLYVKRIGHFVQVEVREVKEASKRGRGPYDCMERSLPPRAFKVILDEGGQEMDSLSFSKFLTQRLNSPPNHVAFIIGGPSGLNQRVLTQGDLTLSLSRMTLTHEMARVFLVEQVYRAITIERGLPYHHQ